MSVASTIGAPVHRATESPVNQKSHSRVEARLERMEAHIEQLEKIVDKLAPEHDECASRFPAFNTHAETVMAYSGCDADVKKETPDTTNITCQDGDSCSLLAPRPPALLQYLSLWQLTHARFGTPVTLTLTPMLHSLASHSRRACGQAQSASIIQTTPKEQDCSTSTLTSRMPKRMSMSLSALSRRTSPTQRSVASWCTTT